MLLAKQEAQEYWRKVLEGVDRPVAKVMMANLDLRHLMGIPASATRGRGRKAPLLPFYEDIKAQHPTKVLLVRVRAMPLRLPQDCLTRAHAHLERIIARQPALALLSAPPPPHQCHSGPARCWQLHARFRSCQFMRATATTSCQGRRTGVPSLHDTLRLTHCAAHRWESSMRPWARMRWCWCSGQA